MAAVRKAVDMTGRIFRELDSPFGRSEADVAREIRRRAKALGAGLAFPPIVASGCNSGYVHHKPGAKIVRGDETVIFDVGFRAGGQCTDVTRMHIPNCRRDRKLLRDMLSIQKRCIAMSRPGVTLKAINDEFRRLMKKKGYKVRHSIGHGVGLHVHERAKALKPGMVITVEPGVYERKKRGCRVEDMVLVTRGGPKILTGNVKFRQA
jgi:Xaa-Pro aminopeptidase